MARRKRKNGKERYNQMMENIKNIPINPVEMWCLYKSFLMYMKPRLEMYRDGSADKFEDAESYKEELNEVIWWCDKVINDGPHSKDKEEQKRLDNAKVLFFNLFYGLWS